MQQILLSFLSILARSILARHRPYVIGVTGSIGKTSIVAHIGAYLTHVYGEDSVGYSHHHYNGEYGLPLTIIGARTGGKNPFLWIWVFFVALWRLTKPYPRYLVLEYGIDHPGEMEFMLSIVVPDIAVITELTPSHLEQFGTFERYREAKLLLADLPTHVILHDSLRQYIDREVTYFGFGAMSDIDTSHIEITPSGTRGRIHLLRQDFDIELSAYGAYHIQNILPLYEIARILDTDPAIIAEYARTFAPEIGRSRLLEGLSDSIIVDGSYNGGYKAIHEGTSSILPLLATHRIILYLGDMRELGDMSESMHRELGEYLRGLVEDHDIAGIYLVGPQMEKYVLPLLQGACIVQHSLSSIRMGEEIEKSLLESKKPTIIYVKGGQNTIFLEEGIKKFLSPKVEHTNLCRQESHWIRVKEKFFKNLNL